MKLKKYIPLGIVGSLALVGVVYPIVTNLQSKTKETKNNNLLVQQLKTEEIKFQLDRAKKELKDLNEALEYFKKEIKASEKRQDEKLWNALQSQFSITSILVEKLEKKIEDQIKDLRKKTLATIKTTNDWVKSIDTEQKKVTQQLKNILMVRREIYILKSQNKDTKILEGHLEISLMILKIRVWKFINQNKDK